MARNLIKDKHMRCIAICAAKGYRLYGVANSFRKRGYTIKLYGKVLHVTNTDNTQNIFIFAYGCLVFWGLKRLQEKRILSQIESFATNPLPAAKYNRHLFLYHKETDIRNHERFNVNIIILENKTPQIKLAISSALAQSVKLEYYEEIVQRAVSQSSNLPEELFATGKIKLSNKAISKQVGKIFTIRSSINLSSVYLEPEYFLERLNINSYYQTTRNFLHIPRRVNVLNQKLNVLHELFEMLTSQLQYRLGTFFKVVATILVIMQVSIGILQLIN